MISRSEYYQASLKVRSLNKEKIFLIGLALKFLFILFLNPYISSNLFIPFLKNTVENFSFNPWNNYLLQEGRVDSFPYGLIMLIAYLPLSFFGNLLDQYFYDLNFLEFGFRLTSLFFDYLLLVFLFLITDYKNKNLLLICYWISPITIYTIYIHGQLDIVPVSLLICSVYFIKLNKFGISGFIFALLIAFLASFIVDFNKLLYPILVLSHESITTNFHPLWEIKMNGFNSNA